MPKVIHVRVYERKLVTDSYTIVSVCCKQLKEVDPAWTMCPYCGDNVEYVESKEETLDVGAAKKG